MDFSGNECIDLRATGSLEVSALKEALKSQCVDESTTTDVTSDPSTSSTSTETVTTSSTIFDTTSTSSSTITTTTTEATETTTKNSGKSLNFIYVNFFIITIILSVLDLL